MVNSSIGNSGLLITRTSHRPQASTEGLFQQTQAFAPATVRTIHFTASSECNRDWFNIYRRVRVDVAPESLAIAVGQHVSPLSPFSPSLAIMGVIRNPATGSAHHQPNAAFNSNPEAESLTSRHRSQFASLSVHRFAAEFVAHFFLSTGKNGHDDERNACQSYARNTVLGNFSAKEIGKPFISNVAGKGDKAGPDNSDTQSLVFFATLFVGVN